MKWLVDYLTRELKLAHDQREIIEYGLSSLVYTALSIFSALLLAKLFGIFKETAAVITVIMLYRKVSGGAHISSAHGCLIIGTIASLILAYLTSLWAPFYAATPAAIILPVCIACYLAYRYVPAAVPQKPITSIAQIKILRLLSFSFILLWAVLGFVTVQLPQVWSYYYFAGNLGLLWQSFLLTPLGYHLLAALSPLFYKKHEID
ncbi:MAG TPA: accessory gene regulator B family protein [Oscillospiraceae bacterium]|nr:accessory gene regulator B family protein [Oscillospiraceae bacterium]